MVAAAVWAQASATAIFSSSPLNVFYAWPLPHELLKYTRKIDLLIVLRGPVLFASPSIFGHAAL